MNSGTHRTIHNPSTGRSKRTGLGLTGFQYALIEGNIIDVSNPVPVQQVASQAIKTLNNRTAGGTFLPLCKDTTGVLKVDSLETAVADALTISLL